MPESALQHLASTHIHTLCTSIPTRRLGSAGNRQATEFFARTAASFGFTVEQPAFSCLDWRSGVIRLEAGGQEIPASISPYSPGGAWSAPLAVVSTVGELEAAEPAGCFLLLRGEIAREPLMPKNFTFYNPEEHQHIVRLLETKAPLAIITATGRDPMMAGAVYPFPMIEDGDFDIPSTYLTDVDGERLAEHACQTVTLSMEAERIPSTGCKVIARKGAGPRIVFSAHIDAKDGTPGALDNAAGVVTLLLLAERLAAYHSGLQIELLALNGEDHYSQAGQMAYLAANTGYFEEILLNINLDGLGYTKGGTAYSFYQSPEPLAEIVRAAFSTFPGLVEGPPWYQGDHMLFVMSGRPAVAITSELAVEIVSEIAHTDKDTPDKVDPRRLSAAALALAELVDRLNRAAASGRLGGLPGLG